MRMTGERGAGNDIKVILLEVKLSYELFVVICLTVCWFDGRSV